MNSSYQSRVYDAIIRDHLAENRQMVFLSGPRQCGKTTLARSISEIYLNWDDADIRKTVLSGQRDTAARIGLDALSGKKRVVVFDELHKYPRWKNFLKGFFDLYGDETKIIATGSAKMNIYKRGGDSLMGRYFPYRMHPLSVAELVDASLPPESLIRAPRPVPDDGWKALCRFGGFPEPFTRRSPRFSRRWTDMRLEQLMHEDVRTVAQVHEVEQIRLLAEILMRRSGEQLSWVSLATDLSADPKSAKKWTEILEYLYFGFEIKPWKRNIADALRKTPKWYLRDWSGIDDIGKRNETMTACHLLKAVEAWTDLGYGRFDLWYIRDKQKREVDFLVTRDGNPWFLAEVKTSAATPSRALAHFQSATGSDHAFQVVFEMPYVGADCFSRKTPVAVPARTFFSQLV